MRRGALSAHQAARRTGVLTGGQRIALRRTAGVKPGDLVVLSLPGRPEGLMTSYDLARALDVSI
ncbi:hypothetical protein GCM10010371_65890 [Streptomyces subrutilus]|uniref:Uncharacterized protein n=1 Tax=Streptomyces subrutilus TaxID=36818 RepID=A0A918VHC7_9ACTN|nr:hypothetical protein GCM10010371_65890 [Streptomyces subrutilus]